MHFKDSLGLNLFQAHPKTQRSRGPQEPNNRPSGELKRSSFLLVALQTGFILFSLLRWRLGGWLGWLYKLPVRLLGCLFKAQKWDLSIFCTETLPVATIWGTCPPVFHARSIVAWNSEGHNIQGMSWMLLRWGGQRQKMDPWDCNSGSGVFSACVVSWSCNSESRYLVCFRKHRDICEGPQCFSWGFENTLKTKPHIAVCVEGGICYPLFVSLLHLLTQWFDE